MDNQKNNFNSDSDLDLLFKEALQNHTVPTEDHVWRRVQHGLADKKGETTPITKSITKRSYLPLWSAVSGVAASLLIWAIFFNPSTSNNVDINSNTIANSSQTEIANDLNGSEGIASLNSDFESESDKNSFINKEENQNTDATSSKIIASNKQIPPTINNKNTASKNQHVKGINPQKHIDRAVASLEKDQTKIKNQKSQEKMNTNTFTNPSTHISQNVWASDFVVQSSTTSTSLKKETNSADTHQLNIDNQTVAITIKVGNNDYSTTTSQATGFDANQNPSQFDKAKTVLKEVWNLKSGKKVNLQNILPNNEKATEKTTTNQSNQNNEIQAD
ncbi:hypothetical protein ACE193_09265 [Bernardetia sp. OM2101]|uniref:hypothetical protein n=1 Tax=Bernardetia sp. OM2101 TaxID=3344876 RepID=UPI0035D08FA4